MRSESKNTYTANQPEQIAMAHLQPGRGGPVRRRPSSPVGRRPDAPPTPPAAPASSASEQSKQQNIHMKHIVLDHREHLQHRKPAHVSARNRLQHRCGLGGHNSRLSSCSACHGAIVHACLLSALDARRGPTAAVHSGSAGHERCRSAGSLARVPRHRLSVRHSRESRLHSDPDRPRARRAWLLVAVVLVIARRLVFVGGGVVRTSVLLVVRPRLRLDVDYGAWSSRQPGYLWLHDSRRSLLGGVARGLRFLELLELGCLFFLLQQLLLAPLAL
ncbi:hypothetical protein BD413DRAFT_83470 [Trametes elegans]|nr:hypothetical protein BD413DRAFT_83470 [Trametes elegans]